jgi:hypothetical protein
MVPYISINVEIKNTRSHLADVFRVLFVVVVSVASLELFGVGPVWYVCCAWSFGVALASHVAAVLRARTHTLFYNIRLFWDEAGRFTIQQADTVILRTDNTVSKAMLAADAMVQGMMNIPSVVSKCNENTDYMASLNVKGTIALYGMPNLDNPCMLSLWDNGNYEGIVQKIQDNLVTYMNTLSTTSAYAPPMSLVSPKE